MFPIPKYSLTPKRDLSRKLSYRLLRMHLNNTLVYLVIPNLPLNVQLMSSGLHTSIRPYSPPIIDPEVAPLDKFHPAVTGVEPLILSTALRSRMTSAKAKIQRRLAAKALFPSIGSQVGVIPLGTAGSLPSKYRNGKSHSNFNNLMALSSHSSFYSHQNTNMGKHIIGCRRRDMGSACTEFRFAGGWVV